MNTAIKIVVLAILLLSLTVSLDAQECGQIKKPESEKLPKYMVKETVKIGYNEPTTNADGTPLTDLAKVLVYYDMGTGGYLAQEIKASSMTGGSEIEFDIMIPVDKRIQGVKVALYAVAVDIHGNESEESNTISVEFGEIKTDFEYVQEHIIKIYDFVDVIKNKPGCTQG